jgi:hypothetical protein
MRNTADVPGKPIAILLQSISGVSAINPLVPFYDIHGGKREVLFFYFVTDTTRDLDETRRGKNNMRIKGVSMEMSDRREWKKKTCRLPTPLSGIRG